MRLINVWCVLRLVLWFGEGVACFAITKRIYRDHPDTPEDWPKNTWISINISAFFLVMLCISFISQAVRTNQEIVCAWFHCIADLIVLILMQIYPTSLDDASEPHYVVQLCIALIIINGVAFVVDCLMIAYILHRKYRSTYQELLI